MVKFVIDCPDCEGTGEDFREYPSGHGQVIQLDGECFWCGGSGDQELTDAIYTCIEEVLEDYPISQYGTRSFENGQS